MHRILALVAAAAIMLGVAAPAALAAEPNSDTRSVVASIAHDVDIPAGDHVDLLVIVRGHADIAGSVDTIVVIDGSATLTGATRPLAGRHQRQRRPRSRDRRLRRRPDVRRHRDPGDRRGRRRHRADVRTRTPAPSPCS